MRKLPTVKSTKTLHDGFYLLKEDLLEVENGGVHPFTTLACGQAVVALAQDSEGRFILNREYRHATGKILLGCPGGRLEEREDPLSGGRREFFEETGYWFDEGILIGTCHPFPSLCEQTLFFIWGKNAFKKGDQHLDPLECIEPVLLTEDDLKKLIHEGHPVDGILLTALWFKEHF